MNFKAIFFDLDGTLLNTLPDLHAACNYALKKNGFKEVTIKKVEESIGDGIGVTIRCQRAEIFEKMHRI